MPFTKWTGLTRGALIVSLVMAAPSRAAIMPLQATMMPKLGDPAGPAAVGDDARAVLAGGPSSEGIDTDLPRLRGGGVMHGTVKLNGVWMGDGGVFNKVDEVREVQVDPMFVDRISDWLPTTMHENPTNWKGAWVSPDESQIDVMYVNSERAVLKGLKYRQWVRAGPRKELYFDPKEVVAAIVTCGGLCPGLNNVVAAITDCLHKSYGVKKVYGIQNGYKGFYTREWKEMTRESVRNIHRRGGTILGSSRGGHDLDKIMEKLIEEGVNQVYVIGGDGTHKGANLISKEAARRKIPMAVCGVPKTIDNDVPFIDKSFGFDTAVQEAVRVIQCAVIEAEDSMQGMAIVKLMGRECGFVSMFATLATNDVDVCLIPESPFQLDLLFKHCHEVIKQKGHCVLVVAEGAGQDHFKDLNLGMDPSGNKRLPDIGVFLKEQAKMWMENHQHNDVEVRYIDPSYQIRSIPATAADSVYCNVLGTAIVHGAMAGMTGMSVGMVCGRYVYIPIDEMCAPHRKVHVDTSSRVYNRMLRHTDQPGFLPEDEENQGEAQQEAKKGGGLFGFMSGKKD
mmetsp:Transcript_44200/g.105240  ORF Transcript_44200/g.105240 Transcript_44200/m.105240 type:complete len:564 (+) Transcript_44200:56-1747(+)|eukprot:CAMPEP_0180136242 /NCGR_PEP_ID=MMETSP0986-20121125/11373_1 /TAXON_ID=697907 /ORGANISM="non described non described, Strain CCMP2293" /LENGTH=563 /DNA_ID=CAMNT_0022077221 /DNA_START=56 /DNA_END=1747 /DNA_ORIENTATION=+